MQRLRTITALLICLTAFFSSAASIVERFGLEHFSLGGASVDTNLSPGLSVVDLATEGTNGVATLLGDADSGPFLFPDTYNVDNGYFMRAHAYGTVDGNTNALIGTLSGVRTDYATFDVAADYSSIGATSLTFQAWSGNLLIRETTVSAGHATIYSEYSKPVRANPWSRQPNGEYGASVEFHYPPSILFPESGGDGAFYANRMFIRPNGATSTVASVSRTDVFGGGGLDSFVFNNVQLGMFGHAHAALGQMKFAASNGVLRVNNLDPLAEVGNGTLIQLNHATTADVQFLPFEMARPNTNEIQERIDISCSGTDATGYIYFISTARLANSNGVLLLSSYRAAEVPTILALYSNSVLVATQLVSGSNQIAITGAPRLAAVRANADVLDGPAGISLDFDIPATFELAQGATVGNRVKISAGEKTGVADLTVLALQARVLPSFTITNETSTFTVPQLSITRSNGFVTLHWADPVGAYSVQGRSPLFDDPWNTFDSDLIVRANGMTSFTYFVGGAEVPAVQFFRLVRYSYND
jgi:hypothetical protein